ncbi:putative nuclease HARBI1, partial [Aphis craccivora]
AVIGDHVHVNKSKICRTIKRVSESICRLRPQVIGAVDCTHIKIQSPNANIGKRFRNRKGYFSFNVQAICESNLNIMNIVARWPGSVHDSIVIDSIVIRAQFENNGFGNCFLLGDGGYPCRDYLMTPPLNPNTEAEKRYQLILAQETLWKGCLVCGNARFPMLAQNDEIPEDYENIINNELLNVVHVNPARQA